MRLYPAIDLLGGQVVRLQQGDYDRKLDYDVTPADLAARWASDGAEFLHVVDLDGARTGAPTNLEVIAEITSTAGIPVQAGGGLRDLVSVERMLDAGASRAVVGSAAIADPAFAGELARSFSDRIVAAVDARAGSVAVEGWTRDSGKPVAEAVAELASAGVSRFLYTPVEADGLLKGPVVDSLAEICSAAESDVIYSGGIGSTADLEELATAAPDHLEGVIVGRALLEGRFTIADATAALSQS